MIGSTSGYSKRNYRYWYNGRPKLAFVRALRRNALHALRALFPPNCALHPKEVPLTIDLNSLPLQEEGGLMPLLQDMVDPRKRRGVRHAVATVVGIAVCAALCGSRIGAG